MEKVNWLSQLQTWKQESELSAENPDKSGVELLYFLDVLSKNLTENDVVVTDVGDSYTTCNSFLKLNGKTRLISNNGCAAMGNSIATAIGVWFADKTKNVIVLIGDGALQMQSYSEFQTIVQHKIPLKIFCLNNGGYHAISLMQDNLFNKERIGSDGRDITNPDFCKISRAYGVKSFILDADCILEYHLPFILSEQCSTFSEIKMSNNPLPIPRVQSYKNEKGEICAGKLEDLK